MLGTFAFSVTSYSFVAAQNVTSTAPTSNATAPGNATTGGNLTAPTSNATAPSGNVTGGNMTGGTANVTGEIETFHVRGHVASIVSGALAGENSTSGTKASSAADQYILGGDVKIDVMNGEAQRVQVNMSMAKPDGSDFHMHLLDNFTAGGAANETTTSNATAPAGNVTAPGNATTGNATTSGNTTAGGNTTTMQQTITGGNATGGGNATTAGNVTGGNVTAPTSNATAPAGNVTAPSNKTTTANLAQATLSQDGTFKISGMVNIYSDGEVKWQDVPVTIESSGRVLTINVDAEKTNNHFMGLPIYGFVTGLIGNQNGTLVSLLPSLTSAAAPTTPAPIAPTTPPTSNATAASNATAPAVNATAPAGNQTTPSAPTTTGGAPSGGGGGSVAVSITSGSSSKTDNAFDPNPVKAKVGDTVTWTNDDTTPHTVVSGSNGTPDGKFDSSPGLKTLITPGQTFSHKFTEAGEYPYFCQLHPGMVGTVSVS